MLWRREIPADRLAAAFRLVLGREMEPADLAKLDKHARRSMEVLYRSLLESDEFETRVAQRPAAGILDVVHAQYFTAQDVETKVEDPEVLSRLMERTAAQWRAHGERDPVWSITTCDEYRADVMTPERLEAFYAGGRVGVDVIAAFERRSGRRLRGGTCLELGAGVGRCTEHLAKIFERVIAVEISPGILDVCRKRMAEKGIGNVDCRLLSRPADLEAFAPYDLFFSTAVLQHNTPPIQRLLLEHALTGLPAGGHCLFQTPDRLEKYAFAAAAYLDSEMWPHDMHCLPRHAVLDVLNAHKMTILDVAPDGFSPEFGSYTYLAQK